MWRAARKHEEVVSDAIDIIEEVHDKKPDEKGENENALPIKDYRKELVKAYIKAGFKIGKLYAPVAVARIVRKVHEGHAELAAEIGVDRARCIDHGDPALGREAAARPDLGFVADGEFNEDAGRNQRTLQGTEQQRLIDAGPQVHAGGGFRGVGRIGPGRLVDDLNFHFQRIFYQEGSG